VDRVEIAGASISTEHLIGGERVGTVRRFECRSPNDWSTLVCGIAAGDAGTARAAVDAACVGFDTWSSTPPARRAVVLRRLAELIEANTDAFARIESLDMGFLERSLRERLVARCALNFRTYADLMETHVEASWPARGTQHTVQRMPAGPAVVITPWNAPLLLSTWKLAPALAAGNSVIHKPAEWAPLTASLLADLAHDAGMPPGAYNLVQGIGEEVGAALVADPRVRRISFTGSPETARSIGRAAAQHIIPFTAELGGKGPLLVFGDADLDAAARLAAAQYEDSGQVCLAGTRLLVDESVRGEFLERFRSAVAAHVLGDSRDPETTIAPVAHPDHLDRIEAFVERARAAGDEIVFGGRRAHESLHYEPTLVVPRSNGSEIVQREVFGPVLTLQTFAREVDAIALANSTAYGLSAIVMTGSPERGQRVGRAIRAGIVWVNTFLVRDLHAPFGGCGISGIGREGGEYALDFHSDLKALIVADPPG
jgi:betaine-aldehyde dehydrogenase/5-carboxymethyl-2-hydroxymuconic-semialdehyde dehydrogenase